MLFQDRELVANNFREHLMGKLPNSYPPWGSKSRVNKAGNALRNEMSESDDILAIDLWRGAHRYVLNTFKPLLWSRTVGKNIISAQRLKRKTTIADKLLREPRMQLAKMDDIAGCRLIFENTDDLFEFREQFNKSKFLHKRKHENELDKYNYIIFPKASGYRGIHDIFTYNTKSLKGAPYNGLFVEIQLRTACQHAWATAVEVVSRITENQPKFDRGDERHIEFFRLASEIITRTVEGMNSCHGRFSNKGLVDEFYKIDGEINLMRLLRGLEIINEHAGNSKSMILQFSPKDELTIHEFYQITRATDAYFSLEKENPSDDIVLVGGPTFAQIRSAYRNYFQDTNEFIRYIDEGIELLLERDAIETIDV
jgi:putative GTP pyrophosphokinase